MRKNTVAPKPSQVVFNPDNYSSTGVSRADILELKDAFDLLDPTSSGKIDAACIIVFTQS
jgi:Ca2+-binding EF-hand superfamily protein